MNTPKDITDALFIMRRDKGINQADLSKACGISQPTLSLIERGYNDPKIGHLYKIASAIGVSIHFTIIDPEDESGNEVITYK